MVDVQLWFIIIYYSVIYIYIYIYIYDYILHKFIFTLSFLF
ncbi:hypothetical protein ACMBCM_07360 [Spiroplasma sp. K1]